jgi:hypothetical protein
MKRLFVFSTLFLFLLAVTACNHELDQPATKAAKGEWQWDYSVGGVSGSSLEPINSTLITLSLNSDSTYTFYLNGETEASGTYAIQATGNASILHLDQRIQINMLSMPPDQVILKWDDSQLQLHDDGLSDGFNHHFVKIK